MFNALLDRLAAIPSRRHAWMTGCIFASAAFAMASIRYAGLHTTFYDLGAFEHFAYRFLGGDWKVLTAAWSEPIPYTHVQPIFLIHALFYGALPSPLTLVAVQAVTLALAFPLLERITIRLAAPPVPQAMTIILALSGPMWFQALFDFHTDHVAIPAALLAINGILERRNGRTMAGLALMALTKENFLITAALLAFVGAFRNRSWTLAGAGGILLVIGGWVILRHLPSATPAGVPALPAFDHLGSDGQGIVTNLLRDPSLALATLDSTKFRYLLLIFGPTLGMAFLGWEFLLPAGFTLAFILLSANPSHSCTCTQYTAGVVPFVLAATALGWSRLMQHLGQSPRRVRWLLAAIMFATAVVFVADSPSPVGRQFVMNKGLFGYSRYLSGWRLGDAAGAAATIPDGAPVAIQNSVNASVLVRRTTVLPFPTGVFEPAPLSGARVAYVVIDTTRDKFMVDRVDGAAYDQAVFRLRSSAELVRSSGTVEVFRLR